MLDFFQIEVLQLSNVSSAPWLLEVKSDRQVKEFCGAFLDLQGKAKPQNLLYVFSVSSLLNISDLTVIVSFFISPVRMKNVCIRSRTEKLDAA